MLSQLRFSLDVFVMHSGGVFTWVVFPKCMGCGLHAVFLGVL